MPRPKDPTQYNEWRKHISESVRNAMACPSLKAHLSEVRKLYCQTPEGKEQLRKNGQAIWAKYGKAQNDKLKEVWAIRAKDPDIRELRRKAARACHEKHGIDAIRQMHTPEAKAKAREATKLFTQTAEFKQKQSLAQKKVWANPEYRQNMSLLHKAKHLRNPKILFNQMKSAFCHPNKAERKLNALLQEHFPNQWKYTGNQGLVIGGYIPDFANINGLKAVIELFGEYWHPVFDIAKKVNHYKQYGFTCLVIWEDELEHPDKIITKVRKFSKRYEEKVK